MRKRILTAFLAAMLIMALCIPAAMADDAYPMYVYTENGKTLNLRESPSTSAKVLLRIDYGEQVWIFEDLGNGWCYGHWGGQFGYMQSRFLVSSKPGPKPTADTGKESSDDKQALEALNRELKTLKALDEPFMVSVRPSRASGRVNFRVGPGTGAARIASFDEGKQLKVVGETKGWYQAVDPDTEKTGFISKNYVTVLPKANIATTTTDPESKQQMGTLNVNGEFALQCRLPEGYTMQVVSMMGTKIVASVNPVDITRPTLYLTVSFDDTYADVERMNDLSDEDLAILEQTFTDMNQVEITYGETAYGTKLLIARETGSDTDFVDILSIYKGYFVEFVMMPNAALSSAALTEEQIKMCIDFLSELDFVPVQ